MRGRRPRCEGTDRGVRCEALVRAEKVSAEGGSAVRECTEVAYRHFAAVGAVSLLPAKHYGAFRQNLALVVHKSDLERARMIAWFDCPIPPVGKLRDLVIGASDERSEEHTSELQSLMRISYAVFCLKKKTLKD